jgi:hypothetical protein
VTDEDMAFQVSTTHIDEQDKPFWKQWKLFHATLAQFTYTGAQGTFSCPYGLFFSTRFCFVLIALPSCHCGLLYQLCCRYMAWHR